MKINWIVSFDQERRLSILSAFLLFSILTAFILMKSSRDALFLSRYPSRLLPYVMVLNTAVSSLAAVLYIRMYRKLPLERITRIALLIFAIGTLLLWKGVDMRIHRISGIIYLWVGIFGTIAPVQGWAMVARDFSARQAKRTVGVVGGGAILGAICGGLLAKLIAVKQDTQLLLAYASLFIFLAMLACFFFPSEESAKNEVLGESMEAKPIRKQFVVLLLLVVATGTIVSAFVDFQFKSLAQQHFTHSRELAGFFGSFYAYIGAATLLLQLWGTPWMMRRLGIATTLALLPVSMLICTAVSPIVGLFNSAVLVRGSEELLRHSVDRSSLEVMYIALPQNIKIRLKSLIDTIGVRVSEGIASLLLIAIFSIANVKLSIIFLLNAALIGFWLVCAVILGKRQYSRLLKEQIQRKEIDLDTVKAHLFTKDFYRLLPEILRNAETQTVLDLLELLHASGKRWLGRYLTVVLQREEPEIRSRTLRILFHQDANLSGQVRRLISDPHPDTRKEAVHYLCLRSRVSKKLLLQLRKADELTIQIAAASSLLKRKALGPVVHEKLEEYRLLALERGDVEARKEIAHLLEFASPEKVAVTLYAKLLSDPSIEVKRATLHSISYTHPISLIPDLLRLMRYPALAGEVREALSSYGPDLLPRISALLRDPEESVVRKKIALKVAADIGAANGLPILLKAARDRELAVRFSAIKALNRMNKQLSIPVPVESVNRLLDEEVNQQEKELRRFEYLSPREGSLLHDFLVQRMQWGLERIFRLLGLLYEQNAIYYSYLAWRSEDQKHKDAALEFLEETVAPDLRARVFPLLETFPLEQGSGQEPHEKRETFLSLLQEKEPLLSAAAIAELSPEEFTEWERAIKEALDTLFKHPLVVEAYERRKTSMTEENRPLGTIEKMENLAKADIFSQLGSHELLLLADQATEVKFEQGAVIFKEGEIACDAFSLIDGQVILERAEKKIGTVNSRESFGAMELLSNRPRLFSAHAARPSTCLKIDREIFWEILEDYPPVSRAILEVLVQQIRDLTDRITSSVSV